MLRPLSLKAFFVMELALAAFTLMPQAASADVEETQVWRDHGAGTVIYNTYGNCVRSQWDVNTNICAPRAATVVTYTPVAPPPPKTIIAEEDRTIYFGFNLATLTDDSQQRLNSLAGRLKAASDVQGAQVVGYADRIGTASYNEVLSEKRAKAVRDYLVAHGIIDTSVAQTHWVGKSEPTASCANGLTHDQLVDCLQPDRKVQVNIVYRKQVQPMTNTSYQPSQTQTTTTVYQPSEE
jgi:outer membrane protein OmpA-like peptidoglycan-associated protein